ncbi:hypothetical protein JOC34_000616 [Virgibacillus halotolerans]|nr:hypothetical protein [Virgibacillus halotolerans]
MTFTGVTKAGKLKLTKSIARSGDKFEPVIGKLICVKKALNEDVEYIDKFVERVENTVWVCNSHNTLPTEVQTDDIWNNMIKKSRRRGLVID